MLFQETGWWSNFTGINALYGVIGILLAVGLGALLLLSKKRQQTDEINEKRATASDALVKVRDTRIIDLEKELDRHKDELNSHKEELEDVTSEYRTLMGIKLDELFKFWATKQDREAHWANVEDENIILRKRLIEHSTNKDA